MSNKDTDQKKTIDVQTIYHIERQREIAVRRRKLGLSVDKLEDNLTGFALSGGGVRAGALGLGVLQALHMTGKLRFFDYLATVSGGGFAGAYLSSLPAKQELGDSANQSPSADTQHTSEHTDDGESTSATELPIAAGKNGYQPRRIQEFLNTSRNFTKPLIFLNRYAIGLVLNWIVIFSGMIALAAGMAWLFQQIYRPVCSDYFEVLGINNDIMKCLLPAVILAILWCAAWGLSYWRKGAHGTGLNARVLFFLLLFTSGISFAALLGAGDVDIASWQHNKQADNRVVNSLFNTVQTFLLTAILAGLLPYLNPMRLFRSGATDAKPVERYVFAVASRALVIGVPFLVMAYFVRENISAFYDYRDGTVYRGELKDISKFDPHHISVDKDAPTIWYAGDDATKQYPVEAEKQTDPNVTVFLNRTISEHFSDLKRNQLLADRHDYEPLPKHPAAFKGTNSDYEIGCTPRFMLLIDHLIHNSIQREDKEKHDFEKYLSAVRANRNTRDAIASAITERLQKPDFAENFLPNWYWTTGASSVPMIEDKLNHLTFGSDSDRKAFVRNLKAARDDAIAVGKFWSTHVANQANLEQKIVAEQEQQENRAILNANRKVIQLYYGDALHNPTTIFSTVAWPYDQQTRWNWFVGATLVFVLFAVLVDINATSCHGYYAAQTADCWIEPSPPYGRNIPLAKLDESHDGRPYHLICGCVRLYGRMVDGRCAEKNGSFIFSKLFCGSNRLAYKRTEEFEDGRYGLPDAIAASGGAVSPTSSDNLLSGALLTLLNFRLGHWVENPAFRPRWPELSNFLRRHWAFTPARWLWSLLIPAEKRAFCLVADGGYYDNLGVEELLRRRLKLIISVDAGQDERHEFEDFARLVRRARSILGVQLRPIDPEMSEFLLHDLTLTSPGESKRLRSWTKNHFVPLEIDYGDGKRGVLIYVKSSLTGDEPFDLLQFQEAHPAFPHTPTSEHLLHDRAQFLSYVTLGRHMTEKACECLPDHLDSISGDELVSHVREWCTARAFADKNRLGGILSHALSEVDKTIPTVTRKNVEPVVEALFRTKERIREVLANGQSTPGAISPDNHWIDDHIDGNNNSSDPTSRPASYDDHWLDISVALQQMANIDLPSAVREQLRPIIQQTIERTIQQKR